MVSTGGGAAGIACLNMLLKLGVKRENVWLCDIHGLVHEGREQDMNPEKAAFAQPTDLRTLDQVIEGADLFGSFRCVQSQLLENQVLPGMVVQVGIGEEIVEKFLDQVVVGRLPRKEPLDAREVPIHEPAARITVANSPKRQELCVGWLVAHDVDTSMEPRQEAPW